MLYFIGIESTKFEVTPDRHIPQHPKKPFKPFKINGSAKLFVS